MVDAVLVPRAAKAMVHADVRVFTRTWRGVNSRTADSTTVESGSMKRHVHLWKTDAGSPDCENFHDSK